MKRRHFTLAMGATLVGTHRLLADSYSPAIKVTLPEAHRGTLEMDTRLLDSFGPPPAQLRSFYLETRQVFEANPQADFSDQAIVDSAQRHQVPVMAGPMLGQVRGDGATLWLRPASSAPLTVSVGDQTFPVESPTAGVACRVQLTGLQPNTRYEYVLRSQQASLATGSFMTAPALAATTPTRVAFGSCCHKIGVHNPHLFGAIRQRQPHALMLLGDIAADDRNGHINMHRADYQLRDVSSAWRDLVAHVPVYAAWDDHDYFDNDLSGVPAKWQPQDRTAVRQVWEQNWNNPVARQPREGIYFNARVGAVEIIMLDTRSCRDNKQRGKYGSYLGKTQLEWLKQTLRESTAPFKIISSGTMWSDYVSQGKDSWGTWDRQGREEILSFIETERIGGVLLVSGDRHGARGFRIPRPSGFTFHEFEPACLGGVPGPAGLVANCPEQLFGYDGQDFIAFGEFTFETEGPSRQVTFRLINQTGQTLEEHPLSLTQLTPGDR